MGSRAEELFDSVAKAALDDAWQIAKRYWPGALTLVLPASGLLVEALNPGEKNLGFRVPALMAARGLLAQSGPLATTSANLSGAASLLTSDEVAKCFPGIPMLAPLPWPLSSGIASTVLQWKASGSWQVLRKGAVIPKDLL